jgi:hypothetical protein
MLMERILFLLPENYKSIKQSFKNRRRKMRRINGSLQPFKRAKKTK